MVVASTPPSLCRTYRNYCRLVFRSSHLEINACPYVPRCKCLQLVGEKILFRRVSRRESLIDGEEMFCRDLSCFIIFLFYASSLHNVRATRNLAGDDSTKNIFQGSKLETNIVGSGSLPVLSVSNASLSEFVIIATSWGLWPGLAYLVHSAWHIGLNLVKPYE